MTSQHTPAITSEIAGIYRTLPVMRVSTPEPTVTAFESFPHIKLTPLRGNTVIFTNDMGVRLSLVAILNLTEEYAEMAGTDAETALEYVMAGDDMAADYENREFFSTIEPNGKWNHRNRLDYQTPDKWDFDADKYDV